jgi:hypothetical protein
MNWDMVTALAAIIGTIAVVASLLYVAQQVKEATRQRKVESYHALLGEVNEGFAKLLAQDHAISDIWWRASKGLEALTDAERVRYFGMLGVLFRSWERAFHYRGVGESEDWRAEVVTKSMTDVTMSRGVQEYWALRRRWYTEDFQHWVDDKIKERGGVDVYGDQFRVFGSAEVKDSS